MHAAWQHMNKLLSSYNYSQLIDCPKELELLLIQIGIKHPTTICVVYNPPNSCVEYKQLLIAYLDNLASNPSPLILMGDFDSPDSNWNTLSGSTTFSNQLCDFIFQYNLLQIVDCPRHIAGNVLDLIFTNCDSATNSLATHSNLVHPVTSDHYLISLTIKHSLSVRHQHMCMIIPKVTMKAYVNSSSTQT